MFFGGGGLVGDQLHDARELLHLEKRVPHPEFGQRPSGGADQLSPCARTSAKRVQYPLAPGRRRLHDR